MNNIIKIKRHPFGGNYLAINLFGFIFTLRDLDPIELNHELIHMFNLHLQQLVLEWMLLQEKVDLEHIHSNLL